MSTQETKQASVTEALAKVIDEMKGVGKDQQFGNPRGGGMAYRYRGIDDMTAAAKPLFGRHGIVWVPRIESMELAQHERQTDCTIMMTWQVFGPAGDSITVGPIVGVGRDSSDKFANKAMTAAWKYALMQTLCVADPADDGDSERLETKPGRQSKVAKSATMSDRQAKAMAALGALPPSTVAAIKDKAREAGIGPVWAEEQCGQIEEWIEAELTAPFDPAPESGSDVETETIEGDSNE
jgi:hypothetical protein